MTIDRLLRVLTAPILLVGLLRQAAAAHALAGLTASLEALPAA